MWCADEKLFWRNFASIISIFKLQLSFLWKRNHWCIFSRGSGRGQAHFRQTDRQTVSMDDVFMVPLSKHPPDRSRFTAGAGTVSPLSGPQRTRWLPYWAAERGDPLSSPVLSRIRSLALCLFLMFTPSPVLIFSSVFLYKWAQSFSAAN